MVDYSSLENCRTERCRGFESLSLRQETLKPADFQRVLFFSPLELPFEVPLFFCESLTWNLGESTIFDRSRVIFFLMSENITASDGYRSSESIHVLREETLTAR